MTLQISIAENQVQVFLRQKDDAPFRRVRCFALQEGQEKTRLIAITGGYVHLLKEGGEDEGKQGDEVVEEQGEDDQVRVLSKGRA